MTNPRLTFHGAARCVTGSCFHLETAAGAVLIDCGLFQGSKTEKELNYRAFPFAADKIAAVILSHAHIDHSGLLPKLAKDGFAGAIHATAATTDLAGVMLPDSAHIQEIEVDQLNRRNSRRNQAPVDPIYTLPDAEACLDLFRAHRYGDWFAVLPDLRARFWNAGHLLGSASVEVEIDQDGTPMRLLFSADIGPDYKLLHPDPEGPVGVDYLICEATYGDTDRQDATAARRRDLLCAEVKAALDPTGVMLIPSFAVERAQELISDLSQLMAEGALPPIPIYVDSPLAEKATKIFAKHAAELEGGTVLLKGLHSQNLHFTESVEDSIALDFVRGFHIVIAASGMCEAGRIRHRLKNWISRQQATVLLVGYQAAGTLGRIIEDGATSVRIQGESFDVYARIRTLDLYSGHADGPELLAWIKERQPVAKDVFLVHGEEAAIAGLVARLDGVVVADRLHVPALDQSFELTPSGAVQLPDKAPPRLAAEKVARMDWHNDVSKLMLDINDALGATADERSRAVLVRKLRQTLEAEGLLLPERRAPRHKRH